jgi:hypothetical protein
MNCRDCEEFADRQLEDDPPPLPPELEMHLAECSACKSLFATVQRLREGLRLTMAPTPPEMLACQTVTKIQSAERWRVQRRWALAAMAAAASLLGAVWYFANRNTNPVETPVVIAPKPSPPLKEHNDPAPQPKESKEPSLSETVQEGRDALDRLADKLFDKTREQADVMRDATVPLEFARLDEPQKRSSNDPPATRPRPGMTTGWQTVAATTRRGLSFMFRDAPSQPEKRSTE